MNSVGEVLGAVSSGSPVVADWGGVAQEFVEAFPLLTLAEVREKQESLYGHPLVTSIVRMLAWATGLQLQRQLKS